MTGRSKTSAQMVDAREKQRLAIALRRDGKMYAEIAEIVGYANKGGAYRAVSAALQEIIDETKEGAIEVRELELVRLDRLLDVAWGMVNDENEDPKRRLDAIDRVIRVLERRARYLGLDAPTKQEVSGPDGEPIRVEDARAFLAEAIARVAADAQPKPAGDGTEEPSD